MTKAVTDLTPTTALGGTDPAHLQIGALTITENTGLGLVSVALRRGWLAPDFGIALPGPGGWTEGNGIAAFWTGPDQWMLEFPGRVSEDLIPDLAALAPGCSLTEQTDGFVCFEIAGPVPALTALLEKLVNVDAGRFGSGSATRTGFHHMSVFVIRRAEDRLALIGMRSAAGTIWHGLRQAATRQEALA